MNSSLVTSTLERNHLKCNVTIKPQPDSQVQKVINREKKFLSFLNEKYDSGSKSYPISKQNTQQVSRNSANTSFNCRITSVMPMVENLPQSDIDNCHYVFLPIPKILTKHETPKFTTPVDDFPGNAQIMKETSPDIAMNVIHKADKLKSPNVGKSHSMKQVCHHGPSRSSSLRKKGAQNKGIKKIVSFNKMKTVFRYVPLS